MFQCKLQSVHLVFNITPSRISVSHQSTEIYLSEINTICLRTTYRKTARTDNTAKIEHPKDRKQSGLFPQPVFRTLYSSHFTRSGPPLLFHSMTGITKYLLMTSKSIPEALLSLFSAPDPCFHLPDERQCSLKHFTLFMVKINSQSYPSKLAPVSVVSITNVPIQPIIQAKSSRYCEEKEKASHRPGKNICIT